MGGRFGLNLLGSFVFEKAGDSKSVFAVRRLFFQNSYAFDAF